MLAPTLLDGSRTTSQCLCCTTQGAGSLDGVPHFGPPAMVNVSEGGLELSAGLLKPDEIVSVKFEIRTIERHPFTAKAQVMVERHPNWVARTFAVEFAVLFTIDLALLGGAELCPCARRIHLC